MFILNIIAQPFPTEHAQHYAAANCFLFQLVPWVMLASMQLVMGLGKPFLGLRSNLYSVLMWAWRNPVFLPFHLTSMCQVVAYLHTPTHCVCNVWHEISLYTPNYWLDPSIMRFISPYEIIRFHSHYNYISYLTLL